MSATAPPANGRPRKQLSDQLDRLDTIIDALADELPDAVANATRDGVRQAFQAVVAGLLADPAVLARLRAALAPAAPAPPAHPQPATPAPTPLTVVAEPRPGVFARLRSAVRTAGHAVARGVAAVAGAATAAAAGTRAQVVEATAQAAATARALNAAAPLRRFLGVALGVSVAVAVTSYALPHSMSAVVSGLGGACAAVAVQAGAWLRRSARSLGLHPA